MLSGTVHREHERVHLHHAVCDGFVGAVDVPIQLVPHVLCVGHDVHVFLHLGGYVREWRARGLLVRSERRRLFPRYEEGLVLREVERSCAAR